MEIVQKPLEFLRAYAGNPRQNDHAVARMVEAITEYGFSVPVLARKDGLLIDGHLRLKAARVLGLEKVPVILCDGWSEAQVRAFRLLVNQSVSWADWDSSLLSVELQSIEELGGDLGLTGFDAGELEEYMAPEPSILTAPESDPLPDQPVTVAGDLWKLGRLGHRILCGKAGSAADVAKLFGDLSPDAVITDPPYSSGGFQESGRSAGSIGTRSSKPLARMRNDVLSTRGYMQLMKRVINATERAATSATKALYIFGDWRQWENSFDLAESVGLQVRAMIVWDKETPGMGVGWRHQHELILLGVRESGLWVTGRPAIGDVIRCKRTGNIHHPTEKPVELLAVLLRTTPFARVVYDPFLGSGSTLLAAHGEGRVCLGMEIEPAYVDVAVSRFELATGEPVTLAGGMGSTFEEVKEIRAASEK